MRPRRLQRGRGRAQARPQAPRQGSASSVAVDSAKRTATLEISKTARLGRYINRPARAPASSRAGWYQGSGGRISLFAFRMRIACESHANSLRKGLGPHIFAPLFACENVAKMAVHHTYMRMYSRAGPTPETLKCGAGRVSCVQVTTDQMQFRSHGHAVFSTHQSMVGPWARGPCGLIGTHRRPRRSLSTGARRPTRSTSRSRWVGQLI